MRDQFLDSLGSHPTIAGIKDGHGLKTALHSPCKAVFLLYGSILNLADIVQQLKAAGKIVFINVDLIDGLSQKEVAVDFVKKTTTADGILSSKAPLIKAAKAQKLLAIHRFFLIDSFSYHNVAKLAELSKPDCIEIMPGCMPKVISWVVQAVPIPLIAGGLVCDHEDAAAAMKAGAVAISSTNVSVWSFSGIGGARPRDRRTGRVIWTAESAKSTVGQP